jgi:hypothetical protein
MRNWYARDTESGFKAAKEGDLVAYQYRPWRVISIREDYEHPKYPGSSCTVLQLRPIEATVTDGANLDIHRGWRSRYSLPEVLTAHYALCVHCGDLMPCREQMAERASTAVMKAMEMYETPGICPACGDPVTHRMQSETFPNVVVPLGAPVTFHMGRRGCARSAEKYRERCNQPESQMRLDGGEE